MVTAAVFKQIRKMLSTHCIINYITKLGESPTILRIIANIQTAVVSGTAGSILSLYFPLNTLVSYFTLAKPTVKKKCPLKCNNMLNRKSE